MSPRPSVDRSCPAFGADGDEPYARALGEATAVLELNDVERAARPVRVPVGRFTGPADAIDLRVLAGARAPVLDVGCGPGPGALRGWLDGGRTFAALGRED